MNIKSISLVLALVCAVYAQEVPGNQLTEEQPAVQQFVAPNEEQNVRSNDQQKPQIIVIEKTPEHNHQFKPHEDQIQAFVIQQNQQQQHHKHDQHKHNEPQKIVVQFGEHKPQQEIIIAHPIHNQQHNKHQQQIFVKPEEVIKIPVPVHEPQHPLPHKPQPPLVSHNRLCVVLGRKGECLSIPNFFTCMRDLGVLTPAIGECSFTQACCVRNWFGQ